MKFLVVAIAALPLCGCHSVPEPPFEKKVSASIAQQVREFQVADASKVVIARIESGNWQFLGYSGGTVEPSFVPALSKEEIHQYIDSGRYKWEVFYYYHSRFGRGSPAEERALWDARMNYAERVNRRLLEEIRKKEPNQAAQTTPGLRPSLSDL